MPLSDAVLNAQFSLIEEAAIKGERCPQSRPFGPLLVNATSELYARGMIMGEISGRNYRQITLLVGKHKGKKTAPDPTLAPVWKTIRKGRGTVGTPKDCAPSAPRALTREELER